mgnify:CR=1 FL=1
MGALGPPGSPRVGAEGGGAVEEGSEMVLVTKWGYSKVKGVAQRGIPQGGEDSPLDFMCMNDVHMRMLERRWEGGYMRRAGQPQRGG